jgi:DNA primase
MSHDLFALAGEYHRALPDRIRDYLHGRGIPDEIINLHRLGWNGERITIPIFSQVGTLAFFKLAKDPDDTGAGSKMITSRGGSIELYGWERVLAKPSRIIICEGEFDRLVLEARGFSAVTSTGGAGAFRREWAADFTPIPEVYLCFDHDEAGRRGAHRTGQLVPHAKIVKLPAEVGPGGDVTDFFVRLGHTREDFVRLLESATPVPTPPPALPVAPEHPASPLSVFSDRIRALKQAAPIADVVGRYVSLRQSGASLRGCCPFHDDHNPSLMVYPVTGSFRCYGCGRNGDVVTFLMAIEQQPFLQALDTLGRFHAHRHADPPTQQ